MARSDYDSELKKIRDAMTLLREAARSTSPADRADKEETAERYLRQAASSLATRRLGIG